MKFCDLHTHSYFSDGTCSPVEIVRIAKERNIAVALSDHNTVSGLPEFVSAAEKLGVEAVPGIEISTEYENCDVHILGLFIKPESYNDITAFVRKADEAKIRSNLDLVKKLNDAGYKFDYSEVIANTKNGRVNRANIASHMIKLGYFSSMDEAFETVLSPDKGFYIRPERINSIEAVEFISSVGALAVIAHPLLSLSPEQIERFIPQAKKHGLVGIETIHSKYKQEDIKTAHSIAVKYGLAESGGSDFHGDNKPGITLAGGEDGVQVPYEFYKKLKELKR